MTHAKFTHPPASGKTRPPFASIPDAPDTRAAGDPPPAPDAAPDPLFDLQTSWEEFNAAARRATGSHPEGTLFCIDDMTDSASDLYEIGKDLAARLAFRARPVVSLQGPTVSGDPASALITCLEALLEAAIDGRITGLAYAITGPDGDEWGQRHLDRAQVITAAARLGSLAVGQDGDAARAAALIAPPDRGGL